MLQLTHYSDGKGDHKSHEIQMIDDYAGTTESITFDNIAGQGATSEDALEDFKKKFNAYLDRLQSFATLLNETDALVPVEVNCWGNQINE